MQNGLRHGDVLRYRRYCSRRLQRLRSALKWSAGPKASIRPRPLPSPLPSPLFLHLLLTSAERCWAFAQQLAGERTEDTPRRRFHQLKKLKRAVDHSTALDVACQAQADTRTQLQAEAYRADMEGSYAFERGDFSFALQRFLHAKAVYSHLGRMGGADLALLCEERLAHQHDHIRMSRYFRKQQRQATATGGKERQGEDEDEEEDEDGGEDGDVSMSASSSVLSSKLQLLLKEREEKAAASLDVVTWQGRTVPVSNAKARLLLARIERLKEGVKGRGGRTQGQEGKERTKSPQTGEAEVDEEEGDSQRSLPSLHQEMANAYDELQKMAKEDLLDAKLEAHRQHLLSLQHFASHERLRALSRRHLLLAEALQTKYFAPPPSAAVPPSAVASSAAAPVKKSKRSTAVKADELVLLYEKLLSNLNDLLDLQSTAQATPSVGNDSGGGGASGGEMALLLQLQQSTAEAHRVFFIAESHIRAHQLMEAAALLHRAEEGIHRAKEQRTLTTSQQKRQSTPEGLHFSSSSSSLSEEAEATLSQLSALERRVGAGLLVLRAKAALQGVGGERETQRALSSLTLAEPHRRTEAGDASKAVGESTVTGPLLSRVDEFSVASHSALYGITDWPPAYAPVPCKTVLFDLAFNAVEYPPHLAGNTAPQDRRGESTAAESAAPMVDEGEEEESPAAERSTSAAESSKAGVGGGGLLGAVGGAVGGLGKWVWRR